MPIINAENLPQPKIPIKQWEVSQRISIEAKLGKIPNISYFMDLAKQYDDGSVQTFPIVKKYTDSMTDPNEEFDLYNPLNAEDMTVIGKAKYSDIQVLLYSLLFHVKNKQDGENKSISN